MVKLRNRYDLLAVLFLFFLVIPAEYFEIFSLLEEQTISVRHLLRISSTKQETSFPIDKIVLVTVDEQFYQNYGGYPINRRDLALIIRNLHQLGAKVIGLDILIDFPSSYNEDPYLAQALRETGNTVLASQAVFSNGQFKELNYPIPSLKDSSTTGYTNMVSTSAVLTSLSRLRIYQEITSEKDGWPISIQILANYLGVVPDLEDNVLILGDQRIELDQFNDIYIDFPAIPEGSSFISELAGISALDFLDLSALDEDEIAELQYFVAGKIVVLGDTSTISHDTFDTPVGTVNGIEIVADVISTLLNNTPLKPAPLLIEILSTALLLSSIILGSAILADPRIRTIMFLVLILSFSIVSTALYVYKGIVLSMSYPMLAAILSFLAISLQKFVQESILRKEMESRSEYIRNTFGRYLSDEIVTELLDTPGGLKLGGEQKKVTIMMSDLFGFTATCERLSPESVVSLINNYLSVMTPIIVNNNGIIDEFIGDAILVIFGAPISHPDDTFRAVACAVEMQLAMEEVNRKNRAEKLPIVEQGIGLHTGTVVVGNIGSELRSKYAVVGKNVNLASRIQSYTIGGQIFISNSTREELAEIIRVDGQMEVMPKGVLRPITIYEVGGIGGKFNLFLPKKQDIVLLDLQSPLPINFSIIDGKDSSRANHPGYIVKLADKLAEIKSDVPVEKMTNLKIALLNEHEEVISEIFGKITRTFTEPNPAFQVSFTYVSPEAASCFGTELKIISSQS